ncbi:MAG: F0F1 ATP synthase subunit A [Myxococcales bacterium]|nr:F0F1 ATP synthase subunit A [Myxococcales bacterium]
MSPDLLPVEVLRLGPLSFTDTLLTSGVISILLVVVGAIAVRVERARGALEIAYEALERSIVETVAVDVRPLVPLVLTLWCFLVVCNLAGLIPGVSTPTRDLSITVALAGISFFAGHANALRVQGLRYLRRYVEPSPLLLPFNLVGEASRTLALALRLFGNMLSGHLVVAIVVYLAGFLLPVPLMLLSVLTSVVQAYIFGVLTLVFAASSLSVVEGAPPDREVPS